jgi:hypothetical protein
MTTQITRRRGTTTEHGSFTGALAETTVDTTKKTVVVHDGTTVGGTPLATEAAVSGKVDRTTQTGSMVLPSGTDAQRDTTPQAGYLRWNTTGTSAEVYDGSAWSPVGGGNSTDQGLYEMKNLISGAYVIGTGNNAISPGPITVSGSVTIPSGSTWVIA